MSTEENKAVFRRLIEESNKGQEAGMAALEELYAPDYVYHMGGFGDMDLAAWKQMALAWYTAFPDMHQFTIEDLIAEEDRVVARCTARATHRGDFMGVPATGKVVTNRGIEIHRIEDGKFVETWDGYDVLGFLQQLGAIPQMAQTGA
jgi:steroid delta-isomerase-like uncharacterized protein